MTSTPDFSHLWMPFTHFQDMVENPPIVIERGEGIYLFDREGRRYLDAIGSWWVNVFGHCNPAISAALHQQIEKLEHVLMAGFVNEPVLELSNRLARILPPKLSRVFYSDNGSTAVEVALKIALQYHRLRGSARSEFVALGRAYHGDTLGAMSVGSIPEYHTIFHERFRHHHFTDTLYCYRCPCGCQKETCSVECLDSLEKLFLNRGENIAACIFEPMVQGAAGMQVYPAKALKRIFDLCERFGILTIDDEIAMGFGRTGTMFACEHAKNVPDIMCLAKALTGGFLPMSATAVSEEIFGEFKGDYASERILNHGHSFTGNALAAATACASMQLMLEHNVPEGLNPLIQHFQMQLEQWRGRPYVGDVRGIGLVGAIELVADPATGERFAASDRIGHRVGLEALHRGLLIRPLGDCVYFMPPYTATLSEIDEMLDATRESVDAVLNA